MAANRNEKEEKTMAAQTELKMARRQIAIEKVAESEVFYPTLTHLAS